MNVVGAAGFVLNSGYNGALPSAGLNVVWALTSVVLEVPSGALADRFGRKPLVVAASVLMVLVVLALGACSALPDKPLRAALYDFGPGLPSTQPATRQAPLPPLALSDISTPGGALDNQAVLYRLAYADAQQLRPYSQARWSM